MVRPDGLFALRAHPFGAALWAFSAAAALCSRLRRSSSAALRSFELALAKLPARKGVRKLSRADPTFCDFVHAITAPIIMRKEKRYTASIKPDLCLGALPNARVAFVTNSRSERPLRSFSVD
jgi:hypothetical protein